MPTSGSVKLTGHATERSRERCIPQFVVDLIEEFGETGESHGCIKWHLSKRALVKIEQYLGRDLFSSFKKYSDCYMVTAEDGTCVTIARRNRKIWKA